jgi:predicted transcriptional regulator
MVRRQIEFDEDTDRILTELAREYHGDLGRARAELVHVHAGLEAFVERCEEAQRSSLLSQVERTEREFDEGRFTNWEDVKRRHKL